MSATTQNPKTNYVFLTFAAILHKLQQVIAPKTIPTLADELTGGFIDALRQPPVKSNQPSSESQINDTPEAARKAAVAELADCIVCCTEEQITAAEHMLLFPYAMEVVANARDKGRLLLRSTKPATAAPVLDDDDDDEEPLPSELTYREINDILAKHGIAPLTGSPESSLGSVPLFACVPSISVPDSGFETLWAECPMRRRTKSQ